MVWIFQNHNTFVYNEVGYTEEKNSRGKFAGDENVFLAGI